MTPIEIRAATVEALEPLTTQGVRVFDSRMFPADLEREIRSHGPMVSVHWTGATEDLDSGTRYAKRTERLAIVAVTGGQESDAACADAIAVLEGEIRDCLFGSAWIKRWADVSDVSSEISMEAGGSRVASLVLRVGVKQHSIKYVPTAPAQSGHTHRVTTDQPPEGDPESIATIPLKVVA